MTMLAVAANASRMRLFSMDFSSFNGSPDPARSHRNHVIPNENVGPAKILDRSAVAHPRFVCGWPCPQKTKPVHNPTRYDAVSLQTAWAPGFGIPVVSAGAPGPHDHPQPPCGRPVPRLWGPGMAGDPALGKFVRPPSLGAPGPDFETRETRTPHWIWRPPAPLSQASPNRNRDKFPERPFAAGFLAESRLARTNPIQTYLKFPDQLIARAIFCVG